MKKFVFTLQSLYDMKIRTEEQQKIQMKKIQDRQLKLNEELNVLKKSFENTKEKHSKRLKEGVLSRELNQYSQYFKDLTSAITRQKGMIAQAEREKQKLLEEQIETKKEIKTLNKLRDSQYQAYLHELKIEEEKIMGDLVSYKETIK